ncbi:MAG TPA: hypothetical protein DHV96_05950 [Lachnospiraceae bacterium]|nr:hypothetical protein [Lachnospiraceae bacterium]
MIRILFFISGGFHKAGTETVVLNIFNNIDKENFSIDFAILGDQKTCACEEIQHIEKNGAHVYYITPRGVDFRRNNLDICELLSKEKYDIVHSHLDAIGANCLRIAKKYGVPVRIAHSHNTAHVMSAERSLKNYLHKLFLNVEKYLTRYYANAYISCSTDAQNWLFGKHVCNLSNSLILKNAIDTVRYKYSEKTDRELREKLGLVDKRVVGHVGRFDYQKNHEYLIDIFEKLKEIDNQVHLLLIGSDGPTLARIEKTIKEKKLQDSVTILKNRDDVADLLNIMDVFVFPSLFEGLGIALIEAQCNGLKCFASDTVPKEVNVVGTVEYLNINREPIEWARCINRYLGNIIQTHEDRNEELVKKAGYDIRKSVKELERFYLNCYLRNST